MARLRRRADLDSFSSPYASLLRLVARLATRQRPAVLYHYTSPSGLLGILNAKSLWASDIWFLNDQKEFKVALDIAETILDEYRHAASTRFHLGLYEALLESLRNVHQSRVYVASFSEDGDLLSQWRGYSPRASGYSIGFLSRRLIDAGQLEPNFFLVPCVYDDDKQRELMVSLLQDVIAGADEDYRHDSEDRVGTYRKAFQLFGSLIAIMGPTFKDQSFEEEQEWRAVSMPSAVDASILRFRAGRYHLIPYCEFALEHPSVHLEVSEVVVGPTPDGELALRAAQLVLAAYRVKYENVVNSTIPYRHW
jgi:hypothetical protein